MIEDKIGRWHKLGREVGLGNWFRSRRKDLLETIGGENNLNDCSIFWTRKHDWFRALVHVWGNLPYLNFTLKVVVQKPMEMRSLVLVTQQRGWVISSFSKTHLMIARKVENDFWDTNCTSHKNREEIQKCIVMAKNWKAIGANIKRAHLKSAKKVQRAWIKTWIRPNLRARQGKWVYTMTERQRKLELRERENR